MDDLFGMLEDNAPAEVVNKPKKAKKDKKDKREKKEKRDKSKKRQANGDVKNLGTDGDEEMLDAGMAEAPQEEETSTLVERKDNKRRRRDQEAEPLVTDTFETAQSREVAASA